MDGYIMSHFFLASNGTYQHYYHRRPAIVQNPSLWLAKEKKKKLSMFCPLFQSPFDWRFIPSRSVSYLVCPYSLSCGPLAYVWW